MKTKFVVSMLCLATFALPSIGQAQLPKAETVSCVNYKPEMKKEIFGALSKALESEIEAKIKEAYAKLHPPGTVKGMKHSYTFKVIEGSDHLEVSVTTIVDAGADSMTAQTKSTFSPGFEYRGRWGAGPSQFRISQSDNSRIDSIGRSFRATRIKCSTDGHFSSFNITNQQSGNIFALDDEIVNRSSQLEIPVQ